MHDHYIVYPLARLLARGNDSRTIYLESGPATTTLYNDTIHGSSDLMRS